MLKQASGLYVAGRHRTRRRKAAVADGGGGRPADALGVFLTSCGLPLITVGREFE